MVDHLSLPAQTGSMFSTPSPLDMQLATTLLQVTRALAMEISLELVIDKRVLLASPFILCPTYKG